jgi:small-conductance mechanosensitive channel
MSLILEQSLALYLILTCLFGGGAAFMMGRSLATNWRPLWQLVVATLIMGLALRFLHFALFEGKLLTLHYYLTDTLTLLVIAGLGYRLTRTTQMVTNYRWLYKRTSPLTWVNK